FTTPFSAVTITANADGTPNKSFDVPPPVVINCRKTKKNPAGLGLRFLEFQVNQKGGVSYGCYDVCMGQDENEKRKDKTVEDYFRDIDKLNVLDVPSDQPQPGVPKQPPAPTVTTQPQPLPDVVTPTGDIDEDKPVQLPPGGVSEW